MKTKKRLWLAFAIAVILTVVAVRNTRSPVRQKAFEQETTVQAPPASSQALERVAVSAPRIKRPAVISKDAESKILEYYYRQFDSTLQDYAPRVEVNLDQLRKLAAIYADISFKRQAYEESILDSTTLPKTAEHPETRTQLDIPAYPEQGKKLKDELYARIRSEVGKETGDELISALDRSLATNSEMWGRSDQSIIISHESGERYSFAHSLDGYAIARARDRKTGQVGNFTATRLVINSAYKTDLGMYAAKAPYLPQG